MNMISRTPTQTLARGNHAALIKPHLTDSGNAERVVYLHGDRIRYVHDARRWHVWDGVSWAPDRLGMAARLAKETATATLLAAEESATGDERSALIKWALQSDLDRWVAAARVVARGAMDCWR
jgi:putative DNA primase/helicase